MARGLVVVGAVVIAAAVFFDAVPLGVLGGVWAGCGVGFDCGRGFEQARRAMRKAGPALWRCEHCNWWGTFPESIGHARAYPTHLMRKAGER